jgi:hypothetical protein
MFSCPTAIGVAFLNWSAAMDGLQSARRLPGPLRLRRAIDEGWLPGLYLEADHDAAATGGEPKPKRRLLAALAGGLGARILTPRRPGSFRSSAVSVANPAVCEPPRRGRAPSWR